MKKLLLAIVMMCSVAGMMAQNTNTLYFMDEISTRNLMNPAFLPRCKSYFDFILLPNLYLGAGENAFAINDMFYTENGKSTTMLSSQSAIDKFLNNMPSSPYLKTDFRLNILNFGARLTRGHYLIFDFNLRNEENIFMPKDLFRFALTGMTDMDGVNKYDLSSFSVNSITYATAGIGYSGRFSDKVTFGFKAKFLLGLANMTTSISQFDLSASRSEWVANAGLRANVTTPFPLTINKTASGSIEIGGMDFSLDKFSPAGYGASFDIGITYEPIKYLTISAAVVDLGFINWGAGYNNVLSINGSYKYDGLGI